MATRKPIAKQEVKKVEPAKKVMKTVEEPVKQKRKPQIKAVDFVGVWQKAESTKEVAEHFDRDAMWASSFATRLRAMGVKLKKMPRTYSGGGGKRLDIDELNSLIED